MSGCTYADKKLTIEFNVSLLRGDSLVIGKIPAVGPGNTWQPPKELADSARLGSGSGKEGDRYGVRVRPSAAQQFFRLRSE